MPDLEIARNLRYARRYLRLRQQTVADYMGIKRQSYAAIENNIRTLQTLEMVRLCNLFRITPNELLGFRKEG